MQIRAFIKTCGTCDHLFAVRNRTTSIAIWPGEVCPWCGSPSATITRRLGTYTEAIGLVRTLREHRRAGSSPNVEVAA